MKISEERLKQLITEEKMAFLEGKVPVAKQSLEAIAMMSARMHDNNGKLSELDSKDLEKLKSIAESLDIMFYRAGKNNG